MTTAIVTLIVGVLIVCVSFFIIDTHNYKEEDEIYSETSDELRRRIMDLSDELYRKYRENVKSLNEELRGKLEREILVELEKYAGQLSEKAKNEMIAYINESLADAFAAYNSDDNKEPEQITYNEDYESPVMKLSDQENQENEPVYDEADNSETEIPENGETAEVTEDVAEEKADEEAQAETETTDVQEETTETENPVSEEVITEEASTKSDEEAQPVEDASVSEPDASVSEPDVSVSEPDVSAPESDELPEPENEAVILDEQPEAEGVQPDKENTDIKPESTSDLQDTAENSIQTAPQKPAGKKKKKKKNKNRNNTIKSQEPAVPMEQEEIWDEEKDIEKEVKELSENGYSIMEIANQLGIGVGEAKTILNKQK